jgi:hypothetical protein
MSKRNQRNPKKQQQTRKKAAPPSPKASQPPAPPPVNWQPLPASAQDDRYQSIFKYASLAILVITILLSLGSGINGDDEYQVDYSNKLVDYYTTFGAEKAALKIDKGNMHYYGGFFDLTTGLVNAALGLTEMDAAYHQVRHVFIAIFGFIAMLFAGLMAREVAGWRAAIVVIAFMFLSPRFLGHSLMNPKDIPFAAGFAVALYYMMVLFRTMPKPKWSTLIGLTLGMALALATRAGGLLLMAYLFLFAGIDFLHRFGLKGLAKQTDWIVKYAIYAVGTTVAAYILAVLTWPAALVDPVNHPLEALTEFSKLGVKIRLLFGGENIMSDDTVWYYPALWISKTVPLFVLFGFLGSLALIPRFLKQYNRLPVYILLFATIFPVAYVIYKDSILHDGWRHLYFIYPSMVALAGIFWVALEKMVAPKQAMRYAVWGVLGLMVLESLFFIVRNPQYPYVYFNALSGGISNAYGYYETDYWGVSVKQAINWMEDEGILREGMQDTVVIGTTFYFNTSRQIGYKYGKGHVQVKYVRFSERHNENWDYGIFPSRFIRGSHLQRGQWPTSKAVHVVRANGIPLVVVEKNETDDAYRGQQAVRARDWQNAIVALSAEVQAHPDNEVAWVGLANAYLNSNNPTAALNAANNALKAAPDTENALFYKALAELRSGKESEAEQTLQKALEVNDDLSVAYYYLAAIYKNRNDLPTALDAIQTAIQKNPRFKAAYELAAQIYESMGDANNAARYRQAGAKL